VSGGGGRGRGTERGNGRTVGERRENPFLFSVFLSTILAIETIKNQFIGKVQMHIVVA